MFLFFLCGLAHLRDRSAQPTLLTPWILLIFYPAFFLLNLSQFFQTHAPVQREAEMMRNQLLEGTIAFEESNELTRLEAQLRIRLRSYVCDFRIMIQDGGLILFGRARTYYGKQLAQHGVMERSRLPILANKIDVL